MPRVIFHLDMDAFYAAIEQRDQPKLRGRPVIVGSPPTQRGVVCAASYEARKFGVRSAMPSATAGRLCPKGIFVAPRLAHYREESRAIMALAAQTGAVIEPMSIDEAYLELSARYRDIEADAALFESVPLARKLKQTIFTERGLTATIPPPAVASTTSRCASSCAFAICSCICWACLSMAFMSNFATTAPPLPSRRADP